MLDKINRTKIWLSNSKYQQHTVLFLYYCKNGAFNQINQINENN